MMHIEALKTRIREVVARSEVPEDPSHAEDTLAWLLLLDPDAGDAMQLAALGHDIDRAVPGKTLRRDFADYDAFKAAHARRSAAILRQMLSDAGASPALTEHVSSLVEQHETGGTAESDLLKDADSLSFFTNNLPAYLAREGRAEALRRCRWGLERLSRRGLALLNKQCFKDATISEIIRKAIKMKEEEANVLDITRITRDLVSAYVGNNPIPASQLPALIESVHTALSELGSEPEGKAAEPPKPAVPIRRSVSDDYLICLEDGKKFKSLKRHLSAVHGMTPQEYREKWGLPDSYPMVAPNYSAARSNLAKTMGLGKRRQ